jgi:hypothetical protein
MTKKPFRKADQGEYRLQHPIKCWTDCTLEAISWGEKPANLQFAGFQHS